MRCRLLALISLTEERDDKCSKIRSDFLFRIYQELSVLKKCTYSFVFGGEHNLHLCDHVCTFSTAYFCVGWICAIVLSWKTLDTWSSTKVRASLWFSEENCDPTEIVVDALDRKRSSPGMRNKRLSRCLPRKRANFVSHNITTAAKNEKK